MKTLQDYLMALFVCPPQTETAIWMIAISYEMIYDGRY